MDAAFEGRFGLPFRPKHPADNCQRRSYSLGGTVRSQVTTASRSSPVMRA
jgi:hypothetical protein